MQIGLCLVLLEKQLGMGQIELAFKYTKKDYFESLRIIFIIAVTGHRCKPVVLHLRSFKGGVQDKSLLRLIYIRCDFPLLRL